MSSWEHIVQKRDESFVRVGLLTPFRYHTLGGGGYPYPNLDWLSGKLNIEMPEPRFAKIAGHLMVCFPGDYKARYDAIFRNKVNVDEETLDEVITGIKWRQDAHPSSSFEGLRHDYSFDNRHKSPCDPSFDEMLKVLLETDYASLLCGRGCDSQVRYMQVRIEPPTLQAERRLLKVIKTKSSYEDITPALYRLVSWPPKGGGGKHLAAARTSLLLDAPGFNIAVLSGQGVYSTTTKEDNMYHTRHIVLQPAEALEDVPRRAIISVGRERAVLLASYCRSDPYRTVVEKRDILDPKNLSPIAKA